MSPRSSLCAALCVSLCLAPSGLIRAETTTDTILTALSADIAPATASVSLDADMVLATTVSQPVAGAAEIAALEQRLGDVLNQVVSSGNLPAQLPDLAEFESYVKNKNKREMGISRSEVVFRTLCKNLNIRLSDIANRAAHDEIHAQEGIFDLTISARSEFTRTEEPLPVQPGTGNDVSRGRTFANSVGLGQLLPTGGLVELLFDNRQNYTNAAFTLDPNYRSSAGVQARQPLLRNAGPLVTQANIVIAQMDNLITNAALRQQVISELSQSLQTYYDLMFAVANVDVLRISLAQAKELERVNTEKFRAGVLPELDVLQAQADVAARQSQVIEALQAVENVSDLLKVRLAEICELRDVALRPTELPDIPNYPLDERKFIGEAILKRPEFEQVRMEIEKSNLRLRVAQNQTLPALDAYAAYFATGAAGTNSDALESVYGTDYNSWKFGLELNYPLQNRAARYRYHQAEKQVDAAFLKLQQTRDHVVLDVRTAIRAIETNLQKVQVGRATVEFNKAKVDSGQKRQAVGLATSFDVLAFQRDLADARIGLIRAIIDYNKAIIALEAAKGTLLEKLNVSADRGMVMQTGAVPAKPFEVSD
ncbi:MAG: TolC family protein [Candidatus Sumerlaeaceae bacterium]|nr:TolC family protein [Candidatus Sumerlaeaceae bacterium]